MNFLDKLRGAIACNQSLLCIGLDPDPDALPVRYRDRSVHLNFLAGLEDWLTFLIAETNHSVCAYTLTLEFYRSLGIPGLELLQTVLATIPADIPVILDAKHGDSETSTVFARTVFLDWKVDAVTLLPYAGQDEVAPFLLYPDKAVFVVCTTANPSATVVQEYPTVAAPLYLQLVREAQNWGTPEQLGFEVGTVVPDILARVRAAAPERVILAPDIWTEDSDNLAQILAAGLNHNGDGLIIPVPQRLLDCDNPAASIAVFQQAINQEREHIAAGHPTCSMWLSNVCSLEQHAHHDLVLQLYDIGCIAFGSYVQASGETFPYYIDLRKIISLPQVLHQVLGAYAEILQDLRFDRIAGIPYGSLPTATGLALRLERPMIFPRKEVKAHGARRLIEGDYKAGETIVVIDDILITGNSAVEGAKKLESVGLQVKDIVVFIDHEKGVKERLQQQGYRGHAVLTMTEIATTLYDAGRITPEQFQALRDFTH